MQARNHENSDEICGQPVRHLDLATPAFTFITITVRTPSVTTLFGEKTSCWGTTCPEELLTELEGPNFLRSEAPKEKMLVMSGCVRLMIVMFKRISGILFIHIFVGIYLYIRIYLFMLDV